MFRNRFAYIFSTLIAVMFVAMMITPTTRLVPTSHAQSTTESDGSSNRASEELDAKFDLAETYDKSAVEADPYAPDDREQNTPTAAAAPAGSLYPIPVPLPGGLDHAANGVGTHY